MVGLGILLIDRRDVFHRALGRYGEFGELRAYFDHFSSLYPVGGDRMEIWHINGEDSYHEEMGGPT